MVALVLMTSFVEFSLRFSKKMPCSVGFSGIVIGLAAFELIKDCESGVDLGALLAILLVVLHPSLRSPRATGAAVGLMLAYTFSNEMIECLKSLQHTKRHSSHPLAVQS